MQSFFQQLSTTGKVFITLSLVFSVLQFFGRPFIGSGANLFGLLGGVSIVVVLIVYFKNKNKSDS